MTMTKAVVSETWYKGWEIGHNAEMEFWTGEGIDAYKGGADLDAPRITGKTMEAVIAEIDEYESDEGIEQ